MKKNQKNKVQRFSARRKVEIVLRVLKGESLDELSRELAVPASRLSEWRDEFLRGGETSVGNEAPRYYCCWNRLISFKVDEGIISPIPLGLVRLMVSPDPGSRLPGVER
jgi:transposase-like protein